MRLVGKPVALMGKEDKIKALRFQRYRRVFDHQSGDKVSKYFGISIRFKATLMHKSKLNESPLSARRFLHSGAAASYLRDGIEVAVSVGTGNVQASAA